MTGPYPVEIFFAVTAKKQARNESLSKAMDQLNQKFGKNTILLCMTPQQVRAFTAPRLLSRAPDMDEFSE